MENYINKLLRMLLLKQTHTKKNKIIIIITTTTTTTTIIIIIIIKGNTNLNLPPHRKSTPSTPQIEAPTATVKEQELSTVATKSSTLEAAGILGPPHSYVSAT